MNEERKTKTRWNDAVITTKDRRVEYQERRKAHINHKVERTTWRHTCVQCGNHIYVQYRHREVFFCSSCLNYTVYKFDDNHIGMNWCEWIPTICAVTAVIIAAYYLSTY